MKLLQLQLLSDSLDCCYVLHGMVYLLPELWTSCTDALRGFFEAHHGRVVIHEEEACTHIVWVQGYPNVSAALSKVLCHNYRE